MKKPLLSSVILVMVLSFLLVVFGCAGPAPAPAPAPTPAPTPTPTPAPAPEVIELKYSHHAPPGTVVTKRFLDPWIARIEDATDGQVKFTTYPAQTLHKSTEAIEATRGGITDVTWIVHGFWPGLFPLSRVITLPFMNLSQGDVDGRIISPGAVNSRIIWGCYEKFPEIRAEYEESGIKLITLHSNYPYILFTREPVRNMEDLKGLKLRELSGPATEMWQLLGASPMMLPMPEVYESAEKGVIDGMAGNWGALVSQRLHEVFPYWTDMTSCAGVFAFIMNTDTWNSLPPDVQEAIMEANSGMDGAEVTGDLIGGFTLMEQGLAVIEESGYTMEQVSLDPGEAEIWREIAGRPLWDKWAADMEAKGLPGNAVLEEALRLVEQYRVK